MKTYRTEHSRDILLVFYEGVVGRWSFPHKSAMVQTRLGETHVITAGDGSKPALVLLHGAASNILGWGAARYAAARPQKACRLVLLAPGGIAPMRIAALLKTILYSMQRKKGAERMKRMVFGKGEILPEVSRFFDLLQQHYVPRIGSPPLLSDEEMKRIACPLLMMTGGEDAFFNAHKTGVRLKRLLPGSEIHIEISGEHGITEYGGRIASFLART